MALYVATVRVLLEVADENAASDGMTAILSEQLRHYGAFDSCLIDWEYADGGTPAPVGDDQAKTLFSEYAEREEVKHGEQNDA